MMENSGVTEKQFLIVDAGGITDQELILLAMFRIISFQRQNDVMRLLEVFTQLSE